MLALSTACSAQLAASHAPATKAQPKPTAAPAKLTPPKPAVRVNGAVLTDIDVLREMYAIFPYAQQHNGFPKDMEADIRKGAIEMIVFEELLYQEANRRNIPVAPERLTKAVASFHKGFPDKAQYTQYLQAECNGSEAVLKGKIRRSMLIDQMLRTEVEKKSLVTPELVKAYYDKNPRQFEHGESFNIQTISIIPPANASKEMKDEAHKKIIDIVRLARAAKTPREFGLIAEQLSDDDWRTKLGDRGAVDIKNLPPEIIAAARSMKPGDVSNAVAVDRAWVVFRLNAHTLAGKTPFVEAKTKLQAELQKQKKLEIRGALNQQLRKNAKIEVL
jgi:hypothetical protein